MSSVSDRGGPEKSPSSLGILHLPDAVARYPDRDCGIYARVSSRGQANNGSLETQKCNTFRECKETCPEEVRRRFIIATVELGQLSAKRNGLKEAIRKAKDLGVILVARDLTRFLRPEDYNRRTNFDAQATTDDLERLLELADGVPLATCLHPDLTNAEIRSLITKAGLRGKRPGRRSSIDPETAVRILNAWRWEELSLDALAARFKKGRQSIFRLTKEWGEYENPALAYRESLRLAAGQLVEP